MTNYKEIIKALMERDPQELKSEVIKQASQLNNERKIFCLYLGAWYENLIKFEDDRECLGYIAGHIESFGWGRDTIRRYVQLGHAVIKGEFPEDIYDMVSTRVAISLQRLKKQSPEDTELIFQKLRSGELSPEDVGKYLAKLKRERAGTEVAFSFDPVEGVVWAHIGENSIPIAVLNMKDDPEIERARSLLVSKITRNHE